MKQILDACCGSRMFWFDKEHPAAVFMDNRSFSKTLCDGRRFEADNPMHCLLCPISSCGAWMSSRIGSCGI